MRRSSHAAAAPSLAPAAESWSVGAWLLYLWPGGIAAWRRGSLEGLAAAVFFAVWLCGLCAATFVWTELAATWLRNALWGGLFLYWANSLLEAARAAHATPAAPQPEQDLFPAALGEYLKGCWFEAESLLRRLVDASPGDVAARLLLVSVYRRSARRREALRELDHVRSFDAAADWRWEINREQQLLMQAASQRSEAEPTIEENKVAALDEQTTALPDVNNEEAAVKLDSPSRVPKAA